MLVKLAESAVGGPFATALSLQPNDDFVVYGTRSHDDTAELLLHRVAAQSYMISVAREHFVQVDSAVPGYWKRTQSWDGAVIEGPPELTDDASFVERLADGDAGTIRVFLKWRELAGDFTPIEGADRVASLISNWSGWMSATGPQLSFADLVYGYKRGWMSLSQAATLATLVSATGDVGDLAWISSKVDPGPEDLAAVEKLANELALEDSSRYRRVWAELLGPYS